MDFNDEELNKLFLEVRETVLAEPKLGLKKSASDDSTSEDSSGESGPTESDGKPPSTEGQKAPEGEGTNATGDAPPPKEGGAPGGDAPAPGGAPAPAEGDPALAAAGAEMPPSPEEIQAAYMELDDESLKLHYEAAKAAIMARAQAAVPGAMGQAPLPAGGALPGAGPAVAPPAAPPAMGAAPGPAAPAPMNPTAMSPPPAPAPAAPTLSPPAQGAPLTPAMKSDTEVTDLKKAQDDLAAKVTAEMATLTAYIESKFPAVRKSVEFAYQIEGVSGPQSLTKSDVDDILSKKIVSHSLHKSDRDLILGYRLGKVTVDQISHLLK